MTSQHHMRPEALAINLAWGAVFLIPILWFGKQDTYFLLWVGALAGWFARCYND